MKRSAQEIFGKEDEDDELPKKKRTSRFTIPSTAVVEEEVALKSNNDPKEINESKIHLDIKAMLSDTRKQIEERKRQTHSILTQQNMSASASAVVPPPASVPLLPLPKPVSALPLPPLQGSVPPAVHQQQQLQQQGLGLTQQSMRIQGNNAMFAAAMQNRSVHPLAYARELQMMRGMTVGPSALDKAMKAAEVRFHYSIGIFFTISNTYFCM